MAKLFKSDWFRCIFTLFLIIICSGASISVLSDVLYVSPQERTARGIQKVYGEEVVYDTIYDVDSEQFTINQLAKVQQDNIETDYGKINKIYVIGDESDKYELLFQSVGYKGFKNGTVTVWVRVLVENDVYAVEKVLLESNKSQSLINNLDAKYYQNFELSDVTKAWKNKEFFTTESNGVNVNPVAGATYSANAGNNAVNVVINYIGEVYGNEN